jgi:3alpha(or 20beta)-hydroxysteroid dehydrogenase
VHAALVDGLAVDGTAVRDTPATHPPLGRFARSEEIAACVVYLLSDASAFVTGASYVLDGGLTAG